MAEGLTISAKDLERWADHPSARHELPRLVRRLLWASTRLRELDMPDDVDQGGFDGVCRAEASSPFCPSGRSVWELSVRGDVAIKIGEDFAKRTKGLPVGSPDAFVAVTPRVFLKKRDWVNERRQEGRWRDVRVIDGQDLSAWLEQCPAVAAWFASEHLGRAVHDLVPLAEFIARWTNATRPPLPRSLVLAERRRQVDQVVNWLAEAPSELYIEAATPEEARVFTASVIVDAEDPTGDRWGSRALVVETASAWRSLVKRTERPLVLIPNFSTNDPLDRGKHFACFPAERAPAGARVVVLEPVPWRNVQRVLQASGFNDARAEHVARESRGHLTALRTLLGLPNLPVWSADPATHAGLAAMLLVGAWDPRVDGDRLALRALNVDPESLDTLCNHLCRATGRPLATEDGAYVWTSQEAAWQDLHPLLSEARLRSFNQAAKDILGEDDPRYDLPVDKRFAAPSYGKIPRLSSVLRRGVADSLLFLARFNDSLRERLGRSLARQLVDDVVRSSLAPEWRCWASLDNLLIVLAEAAPRVFLTCLRASLGSPDGVLRFFEEEGHPGQAHATPHVPLLWALEVLAWDPSTLADAADCLALLADHDPAGSDSARRVANRPAGSLSAIFHRVTPQTLTSEDERFHHLAELAQRRPDVGFDLLIQLVGQDVPSDRSPRPRLDERVPTVSAMPSAAQLEARSARTLDLVITTAGTEPARWSKLVRGALDQIVDAESAEALVAALISRKDAIRDPDASIWNAARNRLNALSMGDSALWRERAVNRMRRVADTFRPKDPWPVFLRTFRANDMPENFSGGATQQIEQRDTLRAEALDTTPDAELESRLNALIEHLGDLNDLGRALGKSARATAFVAKLLDECPPEPWTRLVAPFAAGFYYTHGQDVAWLQDLVRRWKASGRADDIVGTLLRIWAEPQIWDLVDELGEPMRSRYWEQIKRVGEHPGDQWDRVSGNLLAANNLALAFDQAAWHAAHLSVENLLQTLERLNFEVLDRVDGLVYKLERVLTDLDRRVDDKEFDEAQFGRIASIELRFVAVLRHGHRDLRYVRALLERSPEFFAHCVELMSGRDGGPEGARAATGAYEVLSAWTTYPGSDSADPRVWEPHLRAWAERALVLVANAELGLGEVANVLARPEAAEDGHWPCEAAREVLESGRHLQLAEHLHSAKYNLRGVVMYGLTEGGPKERMLAKVFQRGAAALRARWPATAQMLEALAETYVHEAEALDDEAQRERLDSGVSVGDRAVSRLTHIETEHVGPAPMMSLRCSAGINLIAGDNSLGKTFILDVAWWVLTGTWPGLGGPHDAARGSWTANRRIAQPTAAQSHAARIRVFDESDVFAAVPSYRDEEWGRPATWPQTRCPVIYARVDGGYSAWDPLRSDAAIPAYHFSEQALWNGLPGPDGAPVCKGLLTDWHEWRLGNRPLFEALLLALSMMSPDGQAVISGPDVKLRKHDAREIPTLRFPYGDVPFEHLSAGWKRLLGLAYLLVWVWHEHRDTAAREPVVPASSFVLLVDEPEIHLHPRWQRKLLPALLAAAKGLPGGPDVQLLVTTHSPMILASIESSFDIKRDKIFHLRLDEDRKVVVDDLPWAKFGDASAWLESPLFGLGRATSEEAERALAAARALMVGKTAELPPDLTTYSQIDAALRRSLAETHPFWLRWAIFNDERGSL